MPSAAEKRKGLRRPIAYRAYIDYGDGSPARECTLCDASQHGALLAVAEPHSVPHRFTLALSADGAVRRKCRVAWRTKRHIGVDFLKDDKDDLRPIVPPAAPADATEPEADEAVDRIDIDTLTPH